MKVAVFDLDGTLLPGALALDLAYAFARHVDVDINSITCLMSEYQDGAVSHDELMVRLHQILQKTFAGLAVEYVAHQAELVWRQAATRLHHYVWPALESLRGAGYQIWLISGSPAQTVRVAATALGFHQWSATEFAVYDGRFTGELISAPALAGGKFGAFHALLHRTDARKLDTEKSMAVGNSPADAELLEIVGNPFAFEPDRYLARMAHYNNWPVIDRITASAAIRAISATRRPKGAV
ncbi:HAD family hydrolase [Amycolatopsis cihanbeyliensis]|uniref:Phosphoserine phosphatase n=1 Tax=Amycolatopsis cihanbeyliensis TaxID=1128664 RepID=A0A542DI28_AMYCI|nr:haloacid dehalogenase-like hydrolase [Amycolatopsis cihanbeyliensis]TQJ02748.1 phosphoserine phosphatase [Amycolatopsis cihanbeyliensis]